MSIHHHHHHPDLNERETARQHRDLKPLLEPKRMLTNRKSLHGSQLRHLQRLRHQVGIIYMERFPGLPKLSSMDTDTPGQQLLEYWIFLPLQIIKRQMSRQENRTASCGICIYFFSLSSQWSLSNFWPDWLKDFAAILSIQRVLHNIFEISYETRLWREKRLPHQSHHRLSGRWSLSELHRWWCIRNIRAGQST